MDSKELDKKILEILKHKFDRKPVRTYGLYATIRDSNGGFRGEPYRWTIEAKIRNRLIRMKKLGKVCHLPRFKNDSYFWFSVETEWGQELARKVKEKEEGLKIAEDLLMQKCGIPRSNLRDYIYVNDKGSTRATYKVKISTDQFLQIL